MNLLIVASDPMEMYGLTRRCQSVRKIDLAADWIRSAVLGDHQILLIANGVGPVRAALAVDAALAICKLDAIASIGFCGALDSHLNAADIVVADCIQSITRTGATRSFASEKIAASLPHRTGTVCSVETVISSAAAKRELAATGAIAVEMEAAGVAERASALGAPFYCIKTVTDLASENLSIDFNALLRPDGHFDKIRILLSSLRKPAARIPELLRLRKRCLQAGEVLGDFIAGCRF